ncbi:hypothetical protein J6590_045020 [Homalodisca vitripennis]|nr:hypothetical protein J6590_045020 [Homalodisca vitripennis]
MNSPTQLYKCRVFRATCVRCPRAGFLDNNTVAQSPVCGAIIENTTVLWNPLFVPFTSCRQTVLRTIT